VFYNNRQDVIFRRALLRVSLLAMFLTPFLDLGDPVEKFLGVPRHASNTQEDEEQDRGKVELENAPPPVSLKPRIICVAGQTKLVGDPGSNRIEGTGIAIGTGPLDQSKAYFEIKVEEPDTRICAGAIGLHPNSVLAQGGKSISSIPNSIALPPVDLQVGDIVGVVVDISDFPPRVSMSLNGDVDTNTASSVVRGDVWPVVEIITGSVSLIFDRSRLTHLTPARMSRGIESIMIGRSII